MNHKKIDYQNKWKEHVKRMDREDYQENYLNTSQEDIETAEDPYAVESISGARTG